MKRLRGSPRAFRFFASAASFQHGSIVLPYPRSCAGNRRSGWVGRMVEESVVKSVRRYLEHLQVHGLPVRFGVVFGSRVTGHTNEWSDIDLLVISSYFDCKRTWRDIRLLWRIAADADSRIEPVPCGEKEWREDDSRSIVEIARREGQVVEPPSRTTEEDPEHSPSIDP